MSRNLDISFGEYYHLYNRGTNKMDIFLDRADNDRFLYLLYLCNDSKPLHLQFLKRDIFDPSDLFSVPTEPIVAIGAYVLMPNHFHILVKEIKNGGTSAFMQKLTTAYTMYFNKRYERTGALFGGTFKAKSLLTDEYLRYIYSYIHLNPVKLIDPLWKDRGLASLMETRAYLSSYKYSSYLDYLDGEKVRSQSSILNVNQFPRYFETPRTFDQAVIDWLLYSRDVVVKVKP